MRVKPLLYVCLVIFAICFHPTITFANNSHSPEKAGSRTDVNKASNPIAKEAAEKGDKSSQAAENVVEKGSKTPEVEVEASTHSKHSQEIDQENQSDREVENTKPASKNKVSTTQPPQTSDQAAEMTEQLDRKAASKKEVVKKTVEEEPDGKKERSTSSVGKSSKNNEEQTTQTKPQNNNTENAEEAVQPADPDNQAVKGNEAPQTSVTDSEEKNVQKNDGHNDHEFENQEQRDQPLSNPERKKNPITQVHKINPASIPKLGSTNSGDLVGQNSFSFMLKGNLPGFLMFFVSESQVIGVKSELLRDQWVNAPPVKPPNIVS